jgi:RNA polymerase sigma factor (TIGR02999 family)
MIDPRPGRPRPRADSVGPLLEQVYDTLRVLAARRLAAEGRSGRLSATDLVHEVYLRLVGPDPGRTWDGPGHFFAAAARTMRRVLIDRARRRRRVRHGGRFSRVDLDEGCARVAPPDDDRLDLLEALERLRVLSPLGAEVVRLRFLVGLSPAEAAAALGISAATEARHWASARSWLRARLAAPPRNARALPGRPARRAV